ncbi:MAG TPA: hypothetical protein VIA98_01250 [Allosphingosinicella sp.]|jgi:hypothetical protein
MTIEQIVSTAGDGLLRDGSACSTELRRYLTEVPSSALGRYVDYCLSNAFKVGGIVLQDLVNEIGRRLDYEVQNGRYQGTPAHIGYDGLWKSPEGNDVVLEVKTTDAYRISLDVIASYRTKLIAKEELGPNSSILIVVGRQDTGELEAQIRGSKHAWDVRLISAEALLKLLQVKENSNEMETGAKVRSLFAPVEYTRLDRMVDVVFTAATDVEAAPELDPAAVAPANGARAPNTLRPEEGSPELATKAPYQFTDSGILQAKRLAIISALGEREGAHLIQKSRAQYWNASRDVRSVCSISKRYEGKNQNPYWYAYHPQWDAFLEDAERSFFVLGCMDLNRAFAIPRSTLLPILPSLHQTQREQGAYWHIHLAEEQSGLAMVIPGAVSGLSLERFSLPLA